MKELFKDIKFIAYFLITQIIGSLIIILAKIKLSPDWFQALYDCVDTGNVISTEYLSCISEILVPALILADMLIIIPFCINAYRKHKKILILETPPETVTDMIAIGIVLNFLVSFIVEQLPETSSVMTQYTQVVSSVITNNFFLTLLTTGILAPICEELLFRYGMIGCNKENNITKAIILSALMFGIAHMNLVQSTYAFIIGLILGWYYTRQFNLLHPIIMHMTINTTSVLYEYAEPMTKILGTIIVVDLACIYILYRIIHKSNIKDEFGTIITEAPNILQLN